MLGGIIGNLSSKEQSVLNMSGLWEMMWACIILSGPMAAIVINWDWLKSLLSESCAFQALAPELERIKNDGIKYDDLYWMKDRLARFNIPCPPFSDRNDAIPTALLEEDDSRVKARWNIFLMEIVPKAQLGDIEQASQINTNPCSVRASVI